MEVPEGEIERFLIPDPPTYTLEALAEKGGITAHQMHTLWRAMGFPDPPEGELIAGETDVAVLTWASTRLADQFDETIQLLRVFSASLARMAEAAADNVVSELERGQFPDAEEFDQLGGVIYHLYKIQLIAALRRRVTEAEPDSLTQVRAVGFVDMVDFTAISQELEPAELAALVSGFEESASGVVAEEGGRVVKTIGDEVMYLADEPAAAVRIAMRLAGPEVRAGVAYGPVIAKWGDAYGPVVNLASRLENVAYPGAVITSDSIHDALGDADWIDWRPMRPRRLKGIGRVHAWVARPPKS